MKPAIIEKNLQQNPSPEQLEKINRMTRRPFDPDEVFVFSLILCDNSVDRDFERFTRESLKTLEKLFLGKTGIFDHSPSAKNQSARIFDTAMEDLPGEIDGEPCCHLRAWAYMLRIEGNRELILEIDGGIKKEVSVGCAVEKIVCSVCGADQKNEPCAHKKGESYQGVLCHHRLEAPTDAYEWSFVAVPAQRSAGVTKASGTAAGYASLAKLFDAEKEQITLTGNELAALRGQYKALEERAKAGDKHLEELRGQTVRLFAVTRPEISPEMAGLIAKNLEPHALEEVCKALSRAAAKAFPLSPQLEPAQREEPSAGNPFLI